MQLSIVVPVFNEQDNLRPLHERLVAVASAQTDGYEIIFVDDGSNDDSLSIMQRLAQDDSHTRYLSLSRNFGHEIAATAGLDAACGEAVVLIDADLQDQPEVIPEMLDRWKAGAQVVYARRKRRAGETLFKRVSAYLFYRALNLLSDVYIPPDTGDFRLMDQRVVRILRQCRENPRFVRGLVSWIGFRQEAIYYERAERHAGKTKYGFFKLLSLSWEVISAFSVVPLQMAMGIGFLVTLGSAIMACIVAAQKVIWDIPIPGYALLACGMFTLGGIQCMLLGVLGRYLGSVFRYTQERPLYIVDKKGGWQEDHG